MTNNSEYTDIQKLLAELPEVTLPDSLRADALFARMDAQQSAQPAPEPKSGNKIIDITRRLRPVLSYAAVFAVLVLVYYGAGVDKMSAAPAPAAAPEAFMMAADVSASSSAASNEEAVAPQMAAAPIPPQESTEGNELLKAAPRVATVDAETGELIDELDFGELRATVHQLDGAVIIKIVKQSDPSSILRTVTQDGSYTYMGRVGDNDVPQLLVATLTAADVPPTGVDNLHSYPASDNDRYMVLTVLDGSEDAADTTAAVHGSNLIFQAVSDNTFVVFSDAKQDAAAVDVIKLGNAIVELR